jgi:2-polyprenyl-3-methyl-5-hydroxy-6-metoxy-1,4-benzoquinol methylase
MSSKSETYPFTYAAITKKNFRAWNEDMFIRYNNERVYHHVNPFIRFVERKRVNKIVDLLKSVNQKENILCAGCGEGYIESHIKSSNLTLVDISKEAIKRAKKKLGNRSNITYHVADLEDLPFKSTTFDKVECSEVIEHVLSPKRLLSELHRVSKKNGILVISFPNEPLINLIKGILIKIGIFSYVFPNIPEDMTEEWHLRSYSLRSFEKDVKEKWKIVDSYGIPFNVLPLRYVVLCKRVS